MPHLALHGGLCYQVSSLSLYSPVLLPRPAAHPRGYAETEPHIPGGAKVLELEFKCGKYLLKEATYQKVNTADLFPVKLLPGTFMLSENFMDYCVCNFAEKSFPNALLKLK